MINFLSHKFAFQISVFATLQTFSSITQEICERMKNKVHHVNQFIETDQMMHICNRKRPNQEFLPNPTSDFLPNRSGLNCEH